MVHVDQVTPPNISVLFRDTFTASEGPQEGAAIHMLVQALMTEPSSRPFIAKNGDDVLGGLFLTPLEMAQGPRVMLLSPVAVATASQGKGIGQHLIKSALDTLAAEGEVAVVTYGDPAFYGKAGFRSVTVADVPSPYPLSMPHGWIAQPLQGQMPRLQGPASCVAAFNNPDLW